MKNPFFQPVLAACLFAGSGLYAQLPPEDVYSFRGYNIADGKFLDVKTWNQYQSETGWSDMELDVLPWQLPIAAANQIQLKLDNSVVTSDALVGSADTPLNVNIWGLWNSTLNIAADFYITGDINQQGGGASKVNIYNGANVRINRLNTFVSVDIYGAGTELTVSDDISNGGAFSIRDGATVRLLNNKKLNANRAEDAMNVTDSTIYGILQASNGGTLNITGSKVYAGNENNVIQSAGKATLNMDSTEYRLYYTGWDPASTASGWKSNVMFIGLGGGAEQDFTFRNGTVIHGAGAADGTSFLDMDPATRTRADITGGGGFNLGWNAMANDTDYLTVNFESGTKVAAMNVVMGNSSVPNSPSGKITWNQGGTDMDAGYTEVYLKNGFTMNGALVAGSTYSTEANMKGFSLLSADNLDIGVNTNQNIMLSGSSSFNISGQNNTLLLAGSIHVVRNAAGGSGLMSVAGQDNAVTAGSAINIASDSTGADGSFVVDGKNNTISAAGDINIAQNASAGSGSMSVAGIGHVITAGNINIGSSAKGIDASFSLNGAGTRVETAYLNLSPGMNMDTAASGSSSFYAKSDSAASKHQIILTGSEMILQGSQAAGSTYASSFTLDGNVVLRGAEGRGVWLKVNEWGGKNYTSNATFTVSGAGNDVLLSGLEIGKETTDGGGQGTFSVIGGGSDILIASEDGIDNHNGFRIQDGGVLSYRIDNSGISAIKNTTWNNTTFSGRLVVDFNGLTDSFAFEEERYVLFMTVDKSLHLSGRMADKWFDCSDLNDLKGAEDFVSVLLRDKSDEYRFALEDVHDDDLGLDMQALVIYYTSTVPEPATCAALMGALALAFAAYGRRRASL